MAITPNSVTLRYIAIVTTIGVGVGIVYMAVNALLDVVDTPRVLPKIKSLEDIQMEEQVQEWFKLRSIPALMPDPETESTSTPPHPPIIVKTPTPRPRKVIVELGAGDYDNGISKQGEYSGSTIFATNLKSDWQGGEAFIKVAYLHKNTLKSIYILGGKGPSQKD